MVRRRKEESDSEPEESILFNDNKQEADNGTDSDGSESSQEDDRLLADDSSDSDSAPEDRSFKTSRQEALATIKAATTQINQQRAQLKQKRKAKDKQYAEQKRKKVAELTMNKLPDELLENLTPATQKDDMPTDKVISSNKLVKQDDDATDGSDHDSEVDFSDDLGESDYLDLDASCKGPITPVCLPRLDASLEAKGNSVVNVRNERLYSKKIPRQTTQIMINKRKKKNARFV